MTAPQLMFSTCADHFHVMHLISYPSSASKKCSEEQFQCGTSGECIPVNWRCDGNQDCTGGEDEKNCLTAACPPEMFMCNSSNRCITQRWVCDQDQDCDDGSDESECDGKHLLSTYLFLTLLFTPSGTKLINAKLLLS